MNGSSHQCPIPGLKPGDTVHGFEVTRVELIPELRITALALRHGASGADVLHLWNDDVENVFSVNFRTPPPDSTGVPHILEHAVLAGSKRYPVRDAFNELGRSSFRTFLNAFTSRDYTCYPAASTLDIDFYNLADVYFDLVFQPRLARHTFMQEGHHLEFDDAGNLFVTGIVYNEMKGAFSSGERILGSTLIKHLFDESEYGNESGGNPDCMPDLTYDDFVAFHRRMYAPSNARIFFYGSLPPERHLEFLGPRLDALPSAASVVPVDVQPRWTAPRQVVAACPASSAEELTGRSFIQLGWLTPDLADEPEVLAMSVLSEALIGNAGAPLRRAMVESPYGTDLSPSSGFMTNLPHTGFSVGLRGADPEHAEALEALVLESLAALRDGDLSSDALQAAFHQHEIDQREVVRSAQPYGLRLMMDVISPWNHGLDPIAPLRMEPLNALRRRWRDAPSLFADLIDRWLVKNPHRLRVVVAPDPELAERLERGRADRIRTRQAEMSADELDAVRRDFEALQAAQNTPDSPEALATLPRLEVHDIPRNVRVTDTVAGERTLEHDIFANGFGYVDMAFDATGLSPDLRPDLPVFAAVVSGMGAGGRAYDAFAERKMRYTRGVHAMVEVSPTLAGGDPRLFLYVRTGALDRHATETVDILRELVLESDLADRDRMRTIIAERMSQFRAALMPRGHVFARSLAAAAIGPAAALRESLEGIGHLRRLAELVREFDANPAAVVERMETIRRSVLTGNVTLNLVGDAAVRTPLREGLTALVGELPSPGPADMAPIEASGRRRAGIEYAGPIAHTARVSKAPAYLDADAAAFRVANVILRTGFLYQRIRVRGGAYGGFSMYDAVEAEMAMMSYRDPHLDETFTAYDEARQALLDDPLDDETMRKAIITTVAGFDPPRDPRGEGLTAFRRHTIGVTDEMRAEHRARVLSVTADDVRAAVSRWLAPDRPFADAAIASRDRLEASSFTLD